MKLDDRLVVIAGGGGALGRALTLELQTKTNARVYVLDRDQKALDELKEECSRFPHSPHFLNVDLSDAEARKKSIDQLWKLEKRVDVWINAVGFNDARPFSELSPELFQKIMQLNFQLALECCQDIFPRMLLETSGKIVNVASVAGVVPSVYMSAYVAAKHALVGFTRSLQAEIDFLNLGPQTLLVLPGFFESQIIRSGHKSFPEWLSWLIASPESVARALIRAIEKDKKEIVCTANGRLTMSAHKIFPNATIRSSRMGLTRGFRDWVVGRYNY